MRRRSRRYSPAAVLDATAAAAVLEAAATVVVEAVGVGLDAGAGLADVPEALAAGVVMIICLPVEAEVQSRSDVRCDV